MQGRELVQLVEHRRLGRFLVRLGRFLVRRGLFLLLPDVINPLVLLVVLLPPARRIAGRPSCRRYMRRLLPPLRAAAGAVA
jgi:hypothetical protein